MELEPHQNVPPPELVVTIPFLSKPLFKDKEFLQQKYCVEGRSLSQIADEIGSSKEAVRRGLARIGIKRRILGSHHGHPAQPKFGIKVIKGKSVLHLGEAKAIDAITSYRASGLTLRQIASHLNELSIPTKKAGKSWHPEMVNRILSGR